MLLDHETTIGLQNILAIKGKIWWGVKYKSTNVIIWWDFLNSSQLMHNPEWGIGLDTSKLNQHKKRDTSKHENDILSWEPVIIPYNFIRCDYREFLFTC
ncbi:hypothetical protein KY290_001421 [Solanum tuberosum]|uniref:Uncharacterized protein n=1 Tax=Solanum tuberosum TaxID=4113 RepID=A0ABQ7WM59_SOLTU|nr:hypothetical protein KY290_001421 [Solanum tuberosum]